MNNPSQILVVDDDQHIAELIKATLEGENYSIDMVTDGQTALEYLDEHHTDLVILDLKMPGISGFEVLKQIRKHFNYPVIVLTSLSDPESLSQSFSLGADDFIKKPFRAGELVARVRAILRRTCNNK